MQGKFIRNEKGATAIEYALIAAIISLAAIGGAGSVSSLLKQSYEKTALEIEEGLKR